MDKQNTAREFAENNYQQFADSYAPGTDMSPVIRALIRGCSAGYDAASESWIPVSDRLPGDGQLVIAQRASGAMTIVYYWTQFGFHRRNNIVAWMPLPAPYTAPGQAEEGSDEN